MRKLHLVFAALILISAVLAAPHPPSQIYGEVTDNGEAVPSHEVVAKIDGSAVASATTSSDGYYELEIGSSHSGQTAKLYVEGAYTGKSVEIESASSEQVNIEGDYLQDTEEDTGDSDTDSGDTDNDDSDSNDSDSDDTDSDTGTSDDSDSDTDSDTDNDSETDTDDSDNTDTTDDDDSDTDNSDTTDNTDSDNTDTETDTRTDTDSSETQSTDHEELGLTDEENTVTQRDTGFTAPDIEVIDVDIEEDSGVIMASVSLKNYGNETGSKALTLEIGTLSIETKTAVIEPGDIETVRFSKEKPPGEYIVEIAGKKRTVEIADPTDTVEYTPETENRATGQFTAGMPSEKTVLGGVIILMLGLGVYILRYE